MAPPPAASQPTGAASSGRYTDQQRAQDIFVTGVVGRALAAKAANTELTEMDIARYAKWAVASWEARHIPDYVSTTPAAKPQSPDAPLNPPSDPREGEWQSLG